MAKAVERIEVRGTVQGVGFRPHLHRVASAPGIDGDVRDVDGRVVITAAGEPGEPAAFREQGARGRRPRRWWSGSTCAGCRCRRVSRSSRVAPASTSVPAPCRPTSRPAGPA
ncbi:acylphosphatase [Saccharothrix violaceirubra]|uniref:acylphosphatase n=1 Tax=Saccharothrix violaceirubra TaxID=413306 RepID=UPI00161CFFE0